MRKNLLLLSMLLSLHTGLIKPEISKEAKAFAKINSGLESESSKEIEASLSKIFRFLKKLNPKKISAKDYQYIYKNIPTSAPKNANKLRAEGQIYRIWRLMHQKHNFKEESKTWFFNKYSKKTGIKNNRSENEQNYKGTFIVYKNSIEAEALKNSEEIVKIIESKKYDPAIKKFFLKIEQLLLEESKDLLDKEDSAKQISQIFINNINKILDKISTLNPNSKLFQAVEKNIENQIVFLESNINDEGIYNQILKIKNQMERQNENI